MTTRMIFSGILVALLANLGAGVTDAEQEPAVELRVGDSAPLFTGVDDQGNPWVLSDHIGKKVLILYFYPADFTTGCTRQAEAWRDNMNQLTQQGVEVVGVSADTVDNHKMFKKVWQLNFALLSDPATNVARAYGVPVRRGGKVRARDKDGHPLLGPDGERLTLVRRATFRRWTFIIGVDGNIAYKNEKVRPARESENILKFLESMGDSETKEPPSATEDPAKNPISGV